MRLRRRTLLTLLTLFALVAPAVVAPLAAQKQALSTPRSLQVPVDYYKMPNGLKVVSVDRRDDSQRGGRRVLRHRLPHRAARPDRLRAPVRAPDVPGLAAPRQAASSSSSSSRTAEFSTARRASTSRITSRSSRRTRCRRVLWAEADRMRGLGHRQEQSQQPAGRGEERSAGQRAEPAVRRIPVARSPAAREHQLVQLAQLLRRPGRSRRRDARGRAARSSTRTTRRTTPCSSSPATSTRRRRSGGWSSTSPPSLGGAAAEAGHRRAAPGHGAAGEPGRFAGESSGARRSPTTCPSATRPSATRSACIDEILAQGRTAGCTGSWCSGAASPAT